MQNILKSQFPILESQFSKFSVTFIAFLAGIFFAVWIYIQKYVHWYIYEGRGDDLKV